MSGNSNLARAGKGKGVGKKAGRAMAANDRLNTDVLKDGIGDEMAYGLVLKVYGNSWFGLKLNDGRETKALVRDLLSTKRGAPIAPGSVVLVHLPDYLMDGPSKPNPRAFIEGILHKETTVPILIKRGVIPAWMVAAKATDAVGGAGEVGPEAYEFVSADAEAALREEEEKEGGEEESDSEDSDEESGDERTKALKKKARELKRSKARSTKTNDVINVDAI